MPKWAGKWSGGRIRLNLDGSRTWVIEKGRAGRRYVIALAVPNNEPERPGAAGPARARCGGLSVLLFPTREVWRTVPVYEWIK